MQTVSGWYDYLPHLFCRRLYDRHGTDIYRKHFEHNLAQGQDFNAGY